MDALLRWSLANSTPADVSAAAPAPRTDLDPGIIDVILGKPDAQRMKEALEVAIDDKRSEDDRVEALDELEMLVESIDNANDLVKLRMWEPLHTLSTMEASPPAVKMNALWVIGTALQNNPAAQSEYLSIYPIGDILSLMADPSPATRAKASYVLSGLLKHHAAAVAQMESADGWRKLNASLQDPDITIRRKVVFMLNSLLIPLISSDRKPAGLLTSSSSTQLTIHPSSQATSATAIHTPSATSAPIHPNSHASLLSDPNSASTSRVTAAALLRYGVLSKVASELAHPTPAGEDGDTHQDGDPMFQESAVRMLHTYAVECEAQVPQDAKAYVRQFLEAKKGQDFGLSKNEMEEVQKATG